MRGLRTGAEGRAVMTCDRCGKETHASTGSWFNTDQVCLDCAQQEEQHPLIGEAKAAEVAACAQRNFNFEGIGLPESLRRRS